MQFVHDIDISDYIIVYDESTIFLIGQVLGSYYYQPDSIGIQLYKKGIPHRRNIKWIYTRKKVDARLSILGRPPDALYKICEEKKEIILEIIDSL